MRVAGSLWASFFALATIWSGFAASVEEFPGYEVRFFALHVALSTAVILVGVAIRRSRTNAFLLSLMACTYFAAFIIKFYSVVALPELATYSLWMRRFSSVLDNPAFLLDAFAVISWGALVFGVVASLINPLGLKHSPIPIRGRPRPVAAFVLALVLVAGTSLVMYVTGIGLMGAPARRLPFRMAGMVFYIRQTIVPSLLMLVIYCGVVRREKRWLRGGVATLLAFGISDMLLRGSRGGLVSILVLLAGLLYSSRSLTRRGVALFAIGGVCVTAMWPIMTLFRTQRVLGQDIGSAMQLAMSGIGGGLPGGYALLAVQSVFSRLVGVDSLLAAMQFDLGMEPLDVLRYGVTRAFTVIVMGFPEDAIHSSAPSILGWFYLLAGAPAAIAGLAGFTVVGLLGWRLVHSRRLRTAPVAQALWISFIFQTLMGGALDGGPKQFVAVLAGVLAAELMFRATAVDIAPGARVRGVPEADTL